MAVLLVKRASSVGRRVVDSRGRAGTGRDGAAAAVREARETCLTVEATELLGVYDRVLRTMPAALLSFCADRFFCRRAGKAQAVDDATKRWFTPAG
jgi:ADP-ribose pyrophosphatase YjhB (NUDIX family)